MTNIERIDFIADMIKFNILDKDECKILLTHMDEWSINVGAGSLCDEIDNMMAVIAKYKLALTMETVSVGLVTSLSKNE